MKFYIQWCGALQSTCWRSYLKQLICSCLASQFSGKATKVGSPPKFPKLISQLWGIPQPQYFITLLLEAHWTYFWKHFIYYQKDTKVGSQNFGYQIWFCTRLMREEMLINENWHVNFGPTMRDGMPILVHQWEMASSFSINESWHAHFGSSLRDGMFINESWHAHFGPSMTDQMPIYKSWHGHFGYQQKLACPFWTSTSWHAHFGPSTSHYLNQWWHSSLTAYSSITRPQWVKLCFCLGNGLTHWGLLTPYGIGDLGQHWFR